LESLEETQQCCPKNEKRSKADSEYQCHVKDVKLKDKLPDFQLPGSVPEDVRKEEEEDKDSEMIPQHASSSQESGVRDEPGSEDFNANNIDNDANEFDNVAIDGNESETTHNPFESEVGQLPAIEEKENEDAVSADNFVENFKAGIDFISPQRCCTNDKTFGRCFTKHFSPIRLIWQVYHADSGSLIIDRNSHDIDVNKSGNIGVDDEGHDDWFQNAYVHSLVSIYAGLPLGSFDLRWKDLDCRQSSDESETLIGDKVNFREMITKSVIVGTSLGEYRATHEHRKMKNDVLRDMVKFDKDGGGFIKLELEVLEKNPGRRTDLKEIVPTLINDSVFQFFTTDLIKDTTYKLFTRDNLNLNDNKDSFSKDFKLNEITRQYRTVFKRYKRYLLVRGVGPEINEFQSDNLQISVFPERQILILVNVLNIMLFEDSKHLYADFLLQLSLPDNSRYYDRQSRDKHRVVLLAAVNRKILSRYKILKFKNFNILRSLYHEEKVFLEELNNSDGKYANLQLDCIVDQAIERINHELHDSDYPHNLLHSNEEEEKGLFEEKKPFERLDYGTALLNFRDFLEAKKLNEGQADSDSQNKKFFRIVKSSDFFDKLYLHPDSESFEKLRNDLDNHYEVLGYMSDQSLDYPREWASLSTFWKNFRGEDISEKNDPKNWYEIVTVEFEAENFSNSDSKFNGKKKNRVLLRQIGSIVKAGNLSGHHHEIELIFSEKKKKLSAGTLEAFLVHGKFDFLPYIKDFYAFSFVDEKPYNNMDQDRGEGIVNIMSYVQPGIGSTSSTFGLDPGRPNLFSLNPYTTLALGLKQNPVSDESTPRVCMNCNCNDRVSHKFQCPTCAKKSDSDESDPSNLYMFCCGKRDCYDSIWNLHLNSAGHCYNKMNANPWFPVAIGEIDLSDPPPEVLPLGSCNSSNEEQNFNLNNSRLDSEEDKSLPSDSPVVDLEPPPLQNLNSRELDKFHPDTIKVTVLPIEVRLFARTGEKIITIDANTIWNQSNKSYWHTMSIPLYVLVRREINYDINNFTLFYGTTTEIPIERKTTIEDVMKSRSVSLSLVEEPQVQVVPTDVTEHIYNNLMNLKLKEHLKLKESSLLVAEMIDRLNGRMERMKKGESFDDDFIPNETDYFTKRLLLSALKLIIQQCYKETRFFSKTGKTESKISYKNHYILFKKLFKFLTSPDDAIAEKFRLALYNEVVFIRHVVLSIDSPETAAPINTFPESLKFDENLKNPEQLEVLELRPWFLEAIVIGATYGVELEDRLHTKKKHKTKLWDYNEVPRHIQQFFKQWFDNIAHYEREYGPKK